jgi:hypothetical protein
MRYEFCLNTFPPAGGNRADADARDTEGVKSLTQKHSGHRKRRPFFIKNSRHGSDMGVFSKQMPCL